jgi:hypothetical protein
MACCPCQFIQQEDFYGIVPLSRNVESENIYIAINNTQVKFMNPLLCQDLYDELCLQIADDDLTQANIDLLCYLKKIHVCYAYADLLFFHSVQVTKESVVRKFTEESEFIDFDTNAKQANYWENMARNYANEMFEWMKLNINLNPLFDQSVCNDCESHNENLRSTWGIS